MSITVVKFHKIEDQDRSSQNRLDVTTAQGIDTRKELTESEPPEALIKPGGFITKAQSNSGTAQSFGKFEASDSKHVEEIPEFRIARKDLVSPVIHTFRVLQRWEGVVERVDKGSGEFTAVVEDLTDASLPDEQVSLPIDDVPRGDRGLLAPGAVFYWAIGYDENEFGTIGRKSVIRFRRLPSWSERDIQRINASAAEFARELGLDVSNLPQAGQDSTSR